MRLPRAIFVSTACAAVSGCSLLGFGSDPFDDVDLLSDVTLAPEVAEASLAAPAEQTSILDDILAVFRRDAPIEAEPAAVVTTEAGDVAPPDEAEAPDMVVANIAEVGAAEVFEEPASEPTGVLGFLTGLLPDLEGVPEQDDVEAIDAAPLGPPAFGEMRVVCDLATSALGAEVAKVSGYTVYDSASGSVELRPHYVTGFNDRCARRFDAALVLMGDIGTHELVRYAKTGVTLDYSATDEAYEAIKASFCGVRRGVPCGSRIDRLSDDTTFITAYESFGASPQWAEFLLHDGDVAATDIEG